MVFPIGSKLHIRSYDDMVEEYGADAYGDIVLPDENEFTIRMKFLCGSTFTVKSTYEKSSGDIYYLSEEGIEYYYDNGKRDELAWGICNYMFEEYKGFEVCDEVTISEADLLEVIQDV